MNFPWTPTMFIVCMPAHGINNSTNKLLTPSKPFQWPSWTNIPCLSPIIVTNCGYKFDFPVFAFSETRLQFSSIHLFFFSKLVTRSWILVIHLCFQINFVFVNVENMASTSKWIRIYSGFKYKWPWHRTTDFDFPQVPFSESIYKNKRVINLTFSKDLAENIRLWGREKKLQ